MAEHGSSVGPVSSTRRRSENSERRISEEKHGIDHVSNAEMADDQVEVKKITRQIDWRLIPLLMGLYTLTFLDRVNIGNARLWNLERDLHMTGYDYNIVVLGKSERPIGMILYLQIES